MADGNYIAFGDRIRQLRKDAGMSQEDFAAKLGTSKQVLSRYETNQRAPKITLVQEYAKRLEVSVDFLLGDSAEAREVAMAYDRASTKDRNTARLALDLEPVKEGKRELTPLFMPVIPAIIRANNPLKGSLRRRKSMRMPTD